MIKHKTNPLKALITWAKGDFDELNVTLTEAITCRIKDDNPLPGFLFKFREIRPDQGKHSITYHGPSKTPKFTIEELTAKKIDEMGDIVFLEGYNELNNEPLYIIRLRENHEGGEVE